jgi:hypothetical protein
VKYLLLGGLLSVCLLTPDPAHAAPFTITTTVDENCKGTLMNTSGFNQPLPCSFAQDPGPGGLAGAMTYNLLNPPGLVVGDLLMAEPGTGNLSDLIRFNPNGTLVFYSDSISVDALADIAFPNSSYANLLVVQETGPEDMNGFNYTPTAGQPGFAAGAAGPVTYVIQSDVTTAPEPASMALILGGACVLFARKRFTGRAQ